MYVGNLIYDFYIQNVDKVSELYLFYNRIVSGKLPGANALVVELGSAEFGFDPASMWVRVWSELNPNWVRCVDKVGGDFWCGLAPVWVRFGADVASG